MMNQALEYALKALPPNEILAGNPAVYAADHCRNVAMFASKRGAHEIEVSRTLRGIYTGPVGQRIADVQVERAYHPERRN